jgi:hypothetical protein
MRNVYDTCIRSEAAVITKRIDSESAQDAFFSITLFEELAEGKVISELMDIYPNKQKTQIMHVYEHILTINIGVTIPLQQSANILQNLDFMQKSKAQSQCYSAKFRK